MQGADKRAAPPYNEKSDRPPDVLLWQRREALRKMHRRFLLIYLEHVRVFYQLGLVHCL
jgi:hypothetical protein